MTGSIALSLLALRDAAALPTLPKVSYSEGDPDRVGARSPVKS